MTAINVGDMLNLTGATRVLDMSTLKASVAGGPWMPIGTTAEADITPSMLWRLGYNYGIASGPNQSLVYWQALNNQMAAMPNVSCFQALGTMPWSIDANGDVVGTVRMANAAELASMANSNGNNLANRPCVGVAACTYPIGLVPPFAFSVTCKLPSFIGQWPAIWMLPADGSWPPEIDVLEAYNDTGSGVQLTTSLHSSTSGWTENLATPKPAYILADQTATAYVANPVDPVKNFITYMGVVYPDGIFIFYNGVCVQKWPMPTDCNIRWYMLVNVDVRNTAISPLAKTFDSLIISDLAAYKMPTTYPGAGTAPPVVPPVTGTGGGTGTGTGGGTTGTPIPEVMPGAQSITMTNGHVLTLTAGQIAMDNGVAIPNGSGTAAVAYNSAMDPNGILGEDANNPGSWYQYMGSGNWTSTPAPTNMVIVTAPAAPAPAESFTTTQWSAVQAAFASLKSSLGL